MNVYLILKKNTHQLDLTKFKIKDRTSFLFSKHKLQKNVISVYTRATVALLFLMQVSTLKY